MKTLMATLAAVAAVTAAAPVAAQPYGDHRNDRYEQQRGWNRGGHQNFDRRLERIDQRIDQNRRDGDLTRREAARLGEQLIDLKRLNNRYERNGLTRWEISDLDRRLDGLERRVYAQVRDNDYAVRR